MVNGLFLTLGAFYLLMIIFSVYFLNRKKESDVWFEGIWIIIGVVSLIFLFPYAKYTQDFVTGMPSEQDTIALSNVNPNSFIKVSDLIIDDNLIYLSIFSNINNLKENLYETARFCFNYNNTDEENVITINNGVNKISDYVFIKNGIEGRQCTNINISNVQNNALLGIKCLDCNSTNKLNITRVFSENVDQIIITQNFFNIDYNVTDDDALLFFIQARTFPYDAIKNLFTYTIITYGFIILGFGLYFIVIVILLQKKILLK